MTQQELDYAVANATGEELGEVQRIGFSEANPADVSFDPEPYDSAPRVVDWDRLELRRNTPVVFQPFSSQRIGTLLEA